MVAHGRFTRRTGLSPGRCSRLTTLHSSAVYRRTSHVAASGAFRLPGTSTARFGSSTRTCVVRSWTSGVRRRNSTPAPSRHGLPSWKTRQKEPVTRLLVARAGFDDPIGMRYSRSFPHLVCTRQRSGVPTEFSDSRLFRRCLIYRTQLDRDSCSYSAA